MIKTNLRKIRDPFILAEEGVYYLYGTERITDIRDTDWVCYKNTSGRLDGEWKRLDKPFYIRPQNAKTNFWAPEVHRYRGKYYMFVTYYSSLTNRRGCSIFCSDCPEGPFSEITDGHITPIGWYAIDGTFYLDEDNQPWMVFVHEWKSTEDGVGRMAIAKLSEDLTHFISEPVEIFRADDPTWTNAPVTDGCFMYKTKDNQLLMIWSNGSDLGYCVGIARSENGKIDGKWKHDKKLLFSKEVHGKYDGGHGMIFYDFDGKMYLAIHAPNEPIDDVQEEPIFIPLNEKNGTLVCDL